MIKNHDTFTLAETIFRDNEDKIVALEKNRQGHLLFLALIPLIPSLILAPIIWFFSPVLLGTPEPTIPLWLIWVAIYPAFLLLAYPALDRDYRRKAKRNFMNLMAQNMALRYKHGGFMALGELYEHQILPPYTTHEVEEGFKGRYRKFTIEFQDFKIRPVKRLFFFDYRSFFSVRHLRGVIIRVKLNKRLDHHTVLIPSFLTNSFMKRTLHQNFRRHDDIGFVYRKFKQQYTILSTSPTEAHYIFDPAVIERIVTLGESLDAKWLEISFKNMEFVIYAQYGSNFFEIGHLLQPLNLLTIERGLLQMQSLKNVLEILELRPGAGLGANVPGRKNRA